MKEKVFNFTQCFTSEKCNFIDLPESQLEEKHINLLAGELIKQYEILPEKSKKLVKDYLNIHI
jgi:hypothetical protein